MIKEKTFTIIFSVMACAACIGFVVPSAYADTTTDFEQSDYDKDGSVSREEYNKRMVDRFYFFDVDRNGSLSASEASAMTKKDFSSADQSADGSLSLDEYVSHRSKLLSAADTDGNGSLSMEEAQKWKP